MRKQTWSLLCTLPFIIVEAKIGGSDVKFENGAVSFKVAKVPENDYYFRRIPRDKAANEVIQHFEKIKRSTEKFPIPAGEDVLQYETGDFNEKSLVQLDVIYEKKRRRRQQRWVKKRIPNAVPMKHAFLSAVLTAYNLHIPLSLSPDDFWLMISIATAQHINKNAAQLRSNFVSHEGKKALQVDTKYRIWPGRKRENKLLWPHAIHMMSDAIEEDGISNISRIITNPFSTSGIVEQTAFRVALMDTMKEYYEYKFMILCGIPSITLTGTAEDYRSIIARIDQLKTLLPSFHWYLDRVRNDAQQLVKAAEGRPDVDWWRDMVKIQKIDGCGGGSKYIDGWIVNWVGYYLDSGVFIANRKELTGPRVDLDLFNYPAMSMAPVVIKNTLVKWEYKMQFTGGFVGVSQDRKTKRIKPVIGWMTFYHGYPTPYAK